MRRKPKKPHRATFASLPEESDDLMESFLRHARTDPVVAKYAEIPIDSLENNHEALGALAAVLLYGELFDSGQRRAKLVEFREHATESSKRPEQQIPGFNREEQIEALTGFELTIGALEILALAAEEDKRDSDRYHKSIEVLLYSRPSLDYLQFCRRLVQVMAET